MTKRALTFTSFIVGLLMMAAAMTFFAMANHGLADTYGNMNASELDPYNYTKELVNITEATQTQVSGETFEVFGFFTKSSWAAVKLIYGSVGTLGLMLRDAVILFPEVGWIVTIILAIIGVTLVLLIASAIFRYPL